MLLFLIIIFKKNTRKISGAMMKKKESTPGGLVRGFSIMGQNLLWPSF